jgi:hypothetical protein
MEKGVGGESQVINQPEKISSRMMEWIEGGPRHSESGKVFVTRSKGSMIERGRSRVFEPIMIGWVAFCGTPDCHSIVIVIEHLAFQFLTGLSKRLEFSDGREGQEFLRRFTLSIVGPRITFASEPISHLLVLTVENCLWVRTISRSLGIYYLRVY